MENQIARVLYGICFMLLVMFELYKLWFMRSEAIDFEKIIELIVFSSGIVAVNLKVSHDFEKQKYLHITYLVAMQKYAPPIPICCQLGCNWNLCSMDQLYLCCWKTSL